MSSEYREPLPDPRANQRRPTSELWGPWGLDDGNSQPRHDAQASSSPGSQIPMRDGMPGVPSSPQPKNDSFDAQFAPREHVTGSLAAYPSEAPLFQPAYVPYAMQRPGYPPPPQGSGYPPQGQGYPPQGVSPYYLPARQGATYQGQPGYPGWAGYPGYPGYAPGYAQGYIGYPGYPPYGWQPPRPKRDGYLLAMNIVSTVGAGLVLLAGLGSTFFLLLFSVLPHRAVNESQFFSAEMTLIAFACAGIIGGGFSLYHCIRSFFSKRSANFTLPWFWIFVILYLGVVAFGYGLQVNGQAIAFPTLTIFLIMLAGIFPALALLALGVRRLRFPTWPTSWRRFTLALTSGATLGIGLALLLELGLILLLVRGQGTANLQSCIDNPDGTNCQTSAAFSIIFITVAIIGPLVEETVKPLAVAIFIGRVRSAAEAFVLGMACGIGFDLIETVGYIGSGYRDWLTVALERTGAGLLHGFGAAMVTLGWYYLTHSKNRRVLKALACWAYAVFQHFAWNSTAILGFLPDPVGPTLNRWSLNLGFASLPFLEILNIIEAILILVFFIYMTGKLRTKTVPPPPEQGNAQPMRAQQVYART